ncbi:hypothetical protein Tco_0064339 [Tanacetum coccineum]
MENLYQKHGLVALEDLTLYDNEIWNDPRDFAKLVKAIVLPQDVPSTSDHRLIELENQVQRLMEAHLAPTQPTQVNKITTLREICRGPHDTQYCMEDPEQAFYEYASSRTGEAGGALPSDTVKNPKLSTSLVLSARSYPTMDPQSKENEEEEKDSLENIHVNPSTPPDPSGDDGEVMFIELIRKIDDSSEGEPKEEGSTTTEGDISSIIDPMLSQVVLGKPFLKISNMTHDPLEGVVRFINGTDEVSYKMPHKIEQYNSMSDLEKEQTKSVYLRNEEDKRRGVEYVMSKILGFYKECLELGPEYVTGIDDEG